MQRKAKGEMGERKINCKDCKGVLVIVPAYNEEQSILRVAQQLKDRDLEYVVINDGSTDSTVALLESYAIPHISLVENLGIGGAVQTGYRYAFMKGYDVAVQFDGDGQHDADYIRSLVLPLLDGQADIVVGSRFVGSESAFKSSRARRVGINILSSILAVVSHNRVKDVTSGFRAVNRRALELFSANYPTDYPEPESLALAMTSGLKVYETPVAMHERTHGVSSISGLGSLWYMIKVSLSILIVSLFRNTK